MSGHRGTMQLVFARAVVEAACTRGAPRAALLHALGIADTELHDGDRRVSIGRMYAMWDVAMRAVRDEGLPVMVGKLASVRHLGLLGYALYTSPTVGDALHALCRYHDLVNDSGRWTLDVTRKGASVEWTREGPLTLGARVANEQVLASFVTVLRESAGPGASILEVRLRSPRPPRTSTHEAHFGGPIRWGAREWAVSISPEQLGATPRGADPILTDYFAQQAKDHLGRANFRGTASEVAGAVTSLLARGIPQISVVATHVGVSERTLRRRLAEEGTSFDTIVQELQRARAQSLLAAGERVREVAFATGFSDASAFSRAYRRWTGTPPKVAKRRHSTPSL